MIGVNDKPLILIVDDAPSNIQVLAETLRGDYRIKVANSGQAALDIVGKENSRPDLILLDVMMAGMDGHEVCRRLKADPGTQTIPVIFITARYDARDEEYALKLGAADYITKPFHPATVKARVRNHIRLKLATAALLVREEQLKLFIEHAPAAIAMFDKQMHYLAVSQRWVEDFGLSGQNLIGRSHYAIFPTIPQRWKDVHRRCLAGATERGEAELFEENNGSRQWLHWEVRPWKEAAGTIGGVVIFSEDISELQQQRIDLVAAKAQADAARAEAERANAAKSHFLAAASHDLRQPLHALEIYVGLLAASAPQASANLTDKIRQCSENLSALLNDLLDLCKLDVAEIKPQVSVFSLAEFIEQIAVTHDPSAEQKGLLFRVARTRLTARTDRHLLRQLVANLVTNAIRYTEHGGILLGVRRRDGKRWIEVWDTGIGIPADKREEIFEPFHQLDNPARDQERGTGLGLALVQRLARVLELQIRVSSRLGRGSMFAVEAPEGTLLASVDEAQHGSAPQARRRRVALIEDQAFVRDAMTEGLAHLGHEVVAAADLAGLLAELDGKAPDIIVADYRLKEGRTGKEAIAAIRKRYGGHIGAVVITGETDPGVVKSMTESGLRVLHKPVQLEQLRACLEELGANCSTGTATTNPPDTHRT